MSGVKRKNTRIGKIVKRIRETDLTATGHGFSGRFEGGSAPPVRSKPNQSHESRNGNTTGFTDRQRFL